MSGFALKLIAISSMLIDHIGADLLPSQTWMRMAGRLAFPIFAFMLVEGFFHKRDVKKYAIRLGAAAVVSEIPFNFSNSGRFFEPGYMNTCFTLLIGLLTMCFIAAAKQDETGRYMLAAPLALLAGVLLAEFLHTDYGAFGVAMILIFYYFRDKKSTAFVSLIVINLLYGLLCLAFGESPVQALAGAAAVPLYFYNGEKGSARAKYLFYIFYPAHLTAIAAVRYLLLV